MACVDNVIDNVDFNVIATSVDYCGMMAFHDLVNLETTKERIEYCNDVITSCKDDIAYFNKRKLESDYKQQCDIEVWISEREDRINVASHYLENIAE